MVEYGHYYDLIIENCLCILNLMANTLLGVGQAVVKNKRDIFDMRQNPGDSATPKVMFLTYWMDKNI